MIGGEKQNKTKFFVVVNDFIHFQCGFGKTSQHEFIATMIR